MSSTPPQQPSNPLTEVLRGLFGPLLSLIKDWPPLLAFGGVTMLLVVLLALLGAVVPDNLVLLLYLAFGLTELAFAWSLWDERRRAPASPPAPLAQPDSKPVVPVPRPSLQPADELYERYLRHWLQASNQLRLTAIDRRAATRPEAAELDLSEVFTSLDVIETPERPEAKPSRPDPDMSRSRDADGGRRSAIAILAEHSHLVLLGEPGSGKTTLVRFVSTCLAGDGLGLPDPNAGRLGQDWTLPRLIPVPVVLRDYAARGLPAGLSLWAFIAAELERIETGAGNLAPFAPQLERTLERKGGLLLLDGLDEVPDAHRRREQLKAAVERFALDYPRCRILVTSRPYAYQNPAWHLNGFGVRRLADFSPEQIQDFIAKWYAHIAVKDPGFGAENAERYTAQLQNAVQANPRLAELAPRPLLLTLMASLHRWRHGGALPDKREELYDESVKLLVDLWQRPKQLFDAQGNPAGEEYSVWEELRISADNLRAALNQVAFEAHRDQPTTTGTHDIPARLLAGALYQASEDRAAISIDDVCAYVRDRPGPFWLGSGDEDDLAYSDEKPVHQMDVPYDYWLGRYPVTVAQFRAFVAASGQQPGDPDSLRGPDNHPVVWVSWREARAFCGWLAETWREEGVLPEGWTVRLPSEAEWEKGARGGLEIPSQPIIAPIEAGLYRPPKGDAPTLGAGASPAPTVRNPYPRRRYPWGDDPDPDRANYDETGLGATSAVGCFPAGASPYGCLDMSGNVWEWCATRWQDSYQDYRDDNDPAGDARRVVRGGAPIVETSAAPRASTTTRSSVSGTTAFGWWWSPYDAGLCRL